MELNIGDVIVEFRESGDIDGEYTTRIKRVYLVQGTVPSNGDWQAVCLTDTGYTENIPYAKLTSGSGQYVVGGERAVLHAAGLADTKPEIDLNEVERVKNWYDEGGDLNE